MFGLVEPRLCGKGDSLSFSKPKFCIVSQLPTQRREQGHHAVTTVTCHPAGPLSERPLMEVRLGELHTWISTCNFSPQGLLGAVQKGENSWLSGQIHPASLIYFLGPSVQPGSLRSPNRGVMEWFGLGP